MRPEAGRTNSIEEVEAQLEVDEDVKSIPMGKYFASSDKKVRDKAVDNLRQFLIARGDELLDEKDMTRLWKGLFFCYWHSDKPLVQQALASDLAELLLKIPSAVSSLDFLKGFWDMIMREWTKIDHHRIDKFMMLIRRFVNASFRLQRREKWDTDCCEVYEFIMTGPGAPLSSDDPKKQTGIVCHLADLYLDELEKALTDYEEQDVPTIDLLYPFMVYAAQTTSASTHQRIEDELFKPFVKALNSTSDEEPVSKRRKISSREPRTFTNIISKTSVQSRHHTPSTLEEDTSTTEAVRKAFLKTLFDVASRPGAREGNRKKLYGFWKTATAEGQSGRNEWDGS